MSLRCDTIDAVTGVQLREAVLAQNVSQWELRRCSICNAPLCYYFYLDHVEYDSNCDCGSFRSRPQVRSYNDVAQSINIQRTPEARAQMWNKMLGLESADA